MASQISSSKFNTNINLKKKKNSTVPLFSGSPLINIMSHIHNAILGFLLILTNTINNQTKTAKFMISTTSVSIKVSV